MEGYGNTAVRGQWPLWPLGWSLLTKTVIAPFPFPEPLSLERKRQRLHKEAANFAIASSARSTPMTRTPMFEESRASRAYYAEDHQLQARNQDVRMAISHNMSKSPTHNASESSASSHIMLFDSIASQQYFRDQAFFLPGHNDLPECSPPALLAKYSPLRFTFEKARTATSPTASLSTCHNSEISAPSEKLCQASNPVEIAVKNYGSELSTPPFIFTSAPYESPKPLPYPQALPCAKQEPRKIFRTVQAEDSILNFNNSSRIKKIKKPQTKKVAATSKLVKHPPIFQSLTSPCARIKSPTKFELSNFNSMPILTIKYPTGNSKSTNDSGGLVGNNSPINLASPKLPALPKNEIQSSPLKLSTPASASPVRNWIVTTPDHLLPAEFRMMINPVIAPVFQEHNNNHIPRAVIPCWDALPRFPAVQNPVFQAMEHVPRSRGEAYPWLMSPWGSWYCSWQGSKLEGIDYYYGTSDFYGLIITEILQVDQTFVFHDCC